MKFNKRLRFTFTTLFLSFLMIVFSTPSVLLAQSPISNELDFVPGEILVKFKEGLSLQNQRQRVADIQGNVVRSIKKIEVLQIKVPKGQELAMLEKLRAQGQVVFGTLNYRVHALDIPNDPGYFLQWGLTKIEAPEAWEMTTGSNQVIIAVIDSGVDLDHPDLQANLVAGYDYVNGDPVPDDDNSHGTHVAGIVAATGNNSQGVAGLNWQARIMPLKILNFAGDGNIFDLTQAILDAADGGARVINLSLGGSCLFNDWSPVQVAINYAASKGVLIVAASGNEGGTTVLCPGALDQVMAVGSTTEGDFRSSFSNYGTGLDIVAPGSNIYSTLPNGGYGYKSGTSMATPHVAGLAALIWSVDLGLSPEAIQQTLQSTADDLGSPGWDEEYGYGRINAKRALAKLAGLQLRNGQGQEIIAPLQFWVDDETPLPLTTQIYITTNSSQSIDWAASIAPAVSWLNLSPPHTGQVSTASAAQLTLSITSPSAYGTHAATVVVTGTTTTGQAVDPKTVEIRVNYVPQVQRLYFPQVLK